jgi:hypothetical protein
VEARVSQETTRNNQFRVFGNKFSGLTGVYVREKLPQAAVCPKDVLTNLKRSLLQPLLSLKRGQFRLHLSAAKPELTREASRETSLEVASISPHDRL